MIDTFRNGPALASLFVALSTGGCSELEPANTGSALTNKRALVPINLLSPPVTVASMPHALEVPYPLYPNGTKYRIGGESGLKIVAYETIDDFTAVDKYFTEQASKKGLSRHPVMSDYVRYEKGGGRGIDPWEPGRPGVIIHTFTDESEALSYGAAPDSKTNIIISYR